VITLVTAAERPRPDWLRDNPLAWAAAVATVCFGAFMGQLDASIVALAYRHIGADFHAGLGAVQWISLSYLGVVATLLVPIGQLSDRIGRKRVYLWGFALFGAASLACALAPSLPVLVAVRAAQGLGAAMLQANSIALITAVAPRDRLRRALGLQAAAQAVGLALGPTLGGVVVSEASWRWVFAVNVPIAVLAWTTGRFLLPRTRRADPSAPGHAVGSVRAVLGRPGSRASLLGAGAAYLVLFGPIVLVPAILQQRGASALAAGLVTAAAPVGFAFAAAGAGRATSRRQLGPSSERLGLVLVAVGLAGLIVALPAAGLWCAAPLAAVGAGLGLYTPANNTAFMRPIPLGQVSVGGGLISTARALGTAAGTAVVAGTLAVSDSGWAAVAVLLAVTAGAAATSSPTRSGRVGARPAVDPADAVWCHRSAPPPSSGEARSKSGTDPQP
jgi:MFS family permease